MSRPIAVVTHSDRLGPAVNAFSITANNDFELDYVTNSIWVGTGGNLNCTFATTATNTAADAILILNIPTGTKLDLRLKKVGSTGTTASNLIGLI
jgi:hypothetical protein